MRLKLRIGCICISILFVFLLSSNILSNLPTVLAQGDQPTEDMPRLVITPDTGYVLDAGQRFSVKITKNSSDGIEVEGVSVAIQNVIGDEYNYTTGSDGRAYLTAPRNKERITIIASKSGYITSTLEMQINPVPDLIEQIINNKYFIVFLALIFLIIAIIFVNLRQKKSIYSRAKEISKEKTIQKYGLEKTQSSREKINRYGEPESMVKIRGRDNDKIEEIRIIQPHKVKEVIPIKTNKDKRDDHEKKKTTDWFQGTDEVKYEINRLTGEIDEEGKDKWFEGVEDLRDKLDEKMKKKGKKKEDDKD